MEVGGHDGKGMQINYVTFLPSKMCFYFLFFFFCLSLKSDLLSFVSIFLSGTHTHTPVKHTSLFMRFSTALSKQLALRNQKRQNRALLIFLGLPRHVSEDRTNRCRSPLPSASSGPVCSGPTGGTAPASCGWGQNALTATQSSKIQQFIGICCSDVAMHFSVRPQAWKNTWHMAPDWIYLNISTIQRFKFMPFCFGKELRQILWSVSVKGVVLCVFQPYSIDLYHNQVGMLPSIFIKMT